MEQLYEILATNINESFRVSPARPEETDEVMGILIEIAHWLRSQGKSQWGALLEGKDSHDTAGAIRKGNVFVFKHDNEIAGMVMLLPKPSPWDVQLWGDMAHDHDDAVYLHRLAVRRKYAREGLGQSILEWCTSGIRFSDKSQIRLDCVAGNDNLYSFYQRNGFVHVQEKNGYNLFYRKLIEEK